MRILMLCLFLVLGLNATQDMFGRDVDTTDTSRLYFFGPGAVRLATYLGLEDRLVGIDEFDKKAPNLAPYQKHLADKNATQNLKIIAQGGPGKLPSKEAVIKSGASLIVMCDFQKDIVEKFASSVDIPVFALNYTLGVDSENQLNSAKKAIKILSQITGKDKRGDEIVEFMQKQEDELKALNVAKKSVFVGGLGFKGAHGITSSLNSYPPFALLGLKNALSQEGKIDHISISYEALLKSDPELIFIDKSGKKLFDDEMKNHESVFNSLSAFKNDKVYILEAYNQYATNLENIFINAWQIAKILGVEVDINAKKSEILKAFFGE